MTAPRSFLFAAGGSGGHVSPALAVMEELRAHDAEVRLTLVSSDKAIDRQFALPDDVRLFSLPTLSPRGWWRSPWRVTRSNLSACWQARSILNGLRPDVVIGCGGYASLPILLAARWLRLPVVLLEQNVIPGGVTRLASRWAATVCCAFEETRSHLPAASVEITGNPVRSDIRQLIQSDVFQDPPSTLLVLGGSQGSHAINEAMMQWGARMPEGLNDWKIVHQTGESDRERVAEAYSRAGWDAEVRAFFPDLSDAYAAATVAITRAGATTLAELACAGVPAIMIPYPHAADDHQRANALVFQTAGAGRLVDQASDDLVDRVASVLTDWMGESHHLRRASDAMRSMARPNAAAEVATLIRSTS